LIADIFVPFFLTPRKGANFFNSELKKVLAVRIRIGLTDYFFGKKAAGRKCLFRDQQMLPELHLSLSTFLLIYVSDYRTAGM
jgi:hypothetical protein